MTQLSDVLTEAQELGFVGPGPIDGAIEHAEGFAAEIDAPANFVDLGSGGGLPGLVLAARWPAAEVALVEATARRCRFLEEAVASLGFEGRVRVICERAEAAGRRADLRGQFDLVVARSFGSPAVTAECAAPLLRVGGRLVVSEPPSETRSGASRWPSEPLAELGLAPGPAWVTKFHYRSLLQVSPSPDRYPRRVGVPEKRPLY